MFVCLTKKKNYLLLQYTVLGPTDLKHVSVFVSLAHCRMDLSLSPPLTSQQVPASAMTSWVVEQSSASLTKGRRSLSFDVDVYRHKPKRVNHC